MDTPQLLIRMSVQAWDAQIKRAEKIFNGLTDEQLLQEVAPGKNRGVYLLGHLIAVHDAMQPLLGLGERLYPELEEIFIRNPDIRGVKMPSIPELREYWVALHHVLSAHFNAMTAEDWLKRHNAMTDEDLIKDPGRNKLSVFMARTSHIAYHLGQLVFIKKD